MANSLRLATPKDLDLIDKLCRRHKRELGFVRRVALVAGIRNKEILVIPTVAMCDFHLRRDGWTTIYALISEKPGCGKRLLRTILKRGPVRLKCPVNLTANAFYRHIGGRLIRQERSHSAKRRSLNVWEWN